MVQVNELLYRLQGGWDRFLVWLKARRLTQDTLLMVIAVAVGVGSALGVVFFYKLIDVAFTIFFRIPGEHVSRGVFVAYRPLITSIGFVSAHRKRRGSWR